MLIYVHAEDIVDAGRTYPRHAGLDVRHTIIAGGLSTRHTAQQILGLLTDIEQKGPPCVEMLIFNSHGAPGTIFVGEGIDEHNMSTIAAPLGDRLVPLAAGGEGIELHCDQVAAEFRFESEFTRGHEAQTAKEIDPAGLRFVFAMAQQFGTRVRASFDLQMPDRFGFLEGSFIEAVPDESADWHGQVRQLTTGRNMAEDELDTFRWPAAFGLY